MRRAAPFLIVGALALVLGGIEVARPKPYDRRLRAEREGTEPFDAEVLYRLLPDWLGAPVEPVDVTPFERLADTTSAATAYLFVTDTFMPDDAEADRLLAFVRRGGTVVVAADVVGGRLFESLARPSRPGVLPVSEVTKGGAGGLTTSPRPSATGFAGVLGSDDDILGADTLRLGTQTLTFPIGLYGAQVDTVDARRTAVIATDPTTGKPTAVAVAEGRGRIVLATTPLAFTNAALAGRGDAASYVSGVFAYVPPVGRVLWDDTYKPLRAPDRSRLRVAVRAPALRWALWLIGLGTLLAVTVWGRRRQRAIPVVAPPPNAQREFARTVGRLFFVRGDRAWLARRRATLFEDALRTRLGLADADLSDATARRAAARAGVPEDEALALFARLRDLSTEPDPEAAALVRTTRDADAFLAARSTAPTP